MKIVIDTNDYISALIGKKHREKLQTVLLNENIEILADVTLLEEIREVGYRDKFRKYVTINEVDRFIEALKLRLRPVVITSEIYDSPDPDDNFLLAIAKDGNADFLITGDKSDLLILHPYGNISIIRLDAFLTILADQ